MSTVTQIASQKTYATAGGNSATSHTAVADNVHVKSVVSTETQSKVSMENTAKMSQLMARLGSTHSQIDDYSRKRTEQISEEVAASIAKIVAETQIQQQALLQDANVRSAEIEQEYKLKLQRYVEELDGAKALNLSTLEKDLTLRQNQILDNARRRIDDLNEEANRLKMGVLKEAQAQANAKIELITDQVAALGQEDASRRLATKTTTVITTQAKSASAQHMEAAVVGGTTTKTTTESSSHTSTHSAKNH